VGDTFQKLGGLDATAAEAPSLAASVSARLVAQEIVSRELTDCVLVGLGRRPRVRHGKALENLDDAYGVWTTLSTNGLHIDVGRQVYHGGQSDVSDVACPHCGSIELFSDFSIALDDWCKTGTAHHKWPTRTRRSLINDWRLEPQWGVGHLQLTFWNWPPLSKRFQNDVSSYLDGHRLLYIYDKF
jgi:hypothetical protein